MSHQQDQRQPVHFQEVHADATTEHAFPERPFSYIATPIEDSTQNFDEPLAEERGIQYSQQTQNSQNQHQTHIPPMTFERSLQQTNVDQPQYIQPQQPIRPQQQQQYPTQLRTQDTPVFADEKAPITPAEIHPAHYALTDANVHGQPVAMKSEDDLRSRYQPIMSSPNLGYQSSPDTKYSKISSPVPTTYTPYSHLASKPSMSQIQPDVMPYSPNAFAGAPRLATYATGLGNVNDDGKHQPGQIMHPNMEIMNSHWTHSLCACASDDVGTCFTGIFCPCIVYGRTTYRLNQKSKRADPTDMLGYETCNGHCILFSLACGVQGLISGLVRGRVRRLYKIDGGVIDDCVTGCCCCCCALVQSEREVRKREERMRRFAGPGQGGYSAVDDMSYAR